MRMSTVAAETPLMACPECGHQFNRASAINEPGIYATPTAGDTTVCLECRAWLVFRDDLSVRRITPEEARELKPEERTALRYLSEKIEEVRGLAAKRPKMR